jgi:hypothetical protein
MLKQKELLLYIKTKSPTAAEWFSTLASPHSYSRSKKSIPNKSRTTAYKEKNRSQPLLSIKFNQFQKGVQLKFHKKLPRQYRGNAAFTSSSFESGLFCLVPTLLFGYILCIILIFEFSHTELIRFCVLTMHKKACISFGGGGRGGMPIYIFTYLDVCVYVTTRCENRRHSAEPHNRQHYPESGRGGGWERDDATVSIKFGKM